MEALTYIDKISLGMVTSKAFLYIAEALELISCCFINEALGAMTQLALILFRYIWSDG